MNNPTLELRLAPPFYELTQATLLNPPHFTYTVTAHVTLTAVIPGHPPVSSGKVTLPDISISIPGIGIPTVAAFFRHPNYAPHDPLPLENPGWAFVVLPTDTPLLGSPADILSANDLIAAISQSAQLISALAELVSSIDFMLGGLGLLREALQRFIPDTGDEEVPRMGIWIRDHLRLER